MKRTLCILFALLLLSLLALRRLVDEPFVETVHVQEIEVTPIQPPLPQWTVVLPTMQAYVPPPRETLPPPIPAGALESRE